MYIRGIPAAIHADIRGLLFGSLSPDTGQACKRWHWHFFHRYIWKIM